MEMVPKEEEEDVAEVVLSNKGGPKVIHQGYMYTLHKKQPYNIRWRCVGRTLHCRGSLITTTACTQPRVSMEHNHSADFVAAQLARSRYLALGQPRVLPELDDGEDASRQGLTTDFDVSCEQTLTELSQQRSTRQSHRQEFSPRTKSTVKIALIREQKSGKEVLGVIMKQEPEDEEDCLLDESKQSPISSAHAALRVRSHSRSLRAMANPSAVWAHFDLCTNDPLRAQCRICAAVVVRGGANPRQCGTTNLHRHLRVHHGGRLMNGRYHVLPSSQTSSTNRAFRIASTQSLVRPQSRSLAPSSIQHQQQNQHHQQQQQQQKQQQEQPQQQHQQRQSKTVVLKTIPLKMKQVTPSRVASRQPAHGIPPTEVCLRWNSYHSNMQNSFPSLLDTEQFVDVTLACEGRSLKCHKMILSSCSDYLADLLRENPCQHPIILMKDLKFWEVEALVRFMYRGEVNVAHDKLSQLLHAAEALQIKGLAGPSPSSQNSKPPMLIPQPKSVASHAPSRVLSETKDTKASSSGAPAAPSSPKRGQKRRTPEPTEPKPFTKIRLQRPTTPTSPNATVKLEPLDIPLSPTQVFETNHEDSSTPSNFDNLMSLHEEDDPGGDEVDSGDPEMNFCEIAGPSDLHDSEDQGICEEEEFVPTDFLEQEQNCNQSDSGGNDLYDRANDDMDQVEEDEESSKEDLEVDHRSSKNK